MKVYMPVILIGQQTKCLGSFTSELDAVKVLINDPDFENAFDARVDIEGYDEEYGNIFGSIVIKFNGHLNASVKQKYKTVWEEN